VATTQAMHNERETALQGIGSSPWSQWLNALPLLSDMLGESPSATTFWSEASQEMLDISEHLQETLSIYVLGGPEGSDLEELSLHRHAIRNPSATVVASRLRDLLRGIPGVVAIGVLRLPEWFKVITVIKERDLDLWEEIFRHAAGLYDALPGLQAEFIVVDQQDPEGEAVLLGDGVHHSLILQRP